MWGHEEWLNVERWLEPWGDEMWSTADRDISDSERLLDMDFQLQLIDRRLRQIGDAMGTMGTDREQEGERPTHPRILGSILGGERPCDPAAGCSSNLKCPKCPAYQILAAEAVKFGAGAGPQSVEGVIQCRSWEPGRVKTFPLIRRSSRVLFELQPGVRRTRTGARVTVVVKPGAAGGIDIVRGELLGSCQKLNQVRVDPCDKSVIVGGIN